MSISSPARSPAPTRRKFIKSAGAASAAIAMPALILPGRAKGAKKTLKILQWNHFVPGYDRWFKEEYIKEWGQKNDTDVVVHNVGMSSLTGRARAEAAAGRGHDLVMFLRPSPVFEDDVIDHREIYEECSSRFGKPIDLAVRSTYNPKTRKYFGFSDSYTPDPVNYRKDLWDDVGVFPSTWDDIREGGRKIFKRHGIPMGLGIAPELDSNMALRSLMHAFGAAEQDANGRPALKSPQTLAALKYMKAVYEESMTDEVFTWDPSSNNRLLLAGRGSLTVNAISITRTGENKRIPVADRIWLAKAAQGPAQRIGLQHLVDVYSIWKFAENIEGAKQFLVDYVGNFRQAFLASEFYNFPCFPGTVPDLAKLIEKDKNARPDSKYKIFEDVTDWMTNVGYPGYATAPIDELFSNSTITRMFAEAARGRMTPEESMNAAHSEVTKVFDKWRALGKV